MDAEPSTTPPFPEDFDTPLTVRQLAEVERTGVKAVYEALYAGRLEHYRDGRSIRVTRRQWRARWVRGLVQVGTYKADPVRSERARRRALEHGIGR